MSLTLSQCNFDAPDGMTKVLENVSDDTEREANFLGRSYSGLSAKEMIKSLESFGSVIQSACLSTRDTTAEKVPLRLLMKYHELVKGLKGVCQLSIQECLASLSHHKTAYNLAEKSKLEGSLRFEKKSQQNCEGLVKENQELLGKAREISKEIKALKQSQKPESSLPDKDLSNLLAVQLEIKEIKKTVKSIVKFWSSVQGQCHKLEDQKVTSELSEQDKEVFIDNIVNSAIGWITIGKAQVLMYNSAEKLKKRVEDLMSHLSDSVDLLVPEYTEHLKMQYNRR